MYTVDMIIPVNVCWTIYLVLYEQMRGFSTHGFPKRLYIKLYYTEEWTLYWFIIGKHKMIIEKSANQLFIILNNKRINCVVPYYDSCVL